MHVTHSFIRFKFNATSISNYKIINAVTKFGCKSKQSEKSTASSRNTFECVDTMYTTVCLCLYIYSSVPNKIIGCAHKITTKNQRE